MKYPGLSLNGNRNLIDKSLIFFVLVMAIIAMRPPDAVKNDKVIIGYVGGFRGLINAASIDATKLTHINYAFVDVKDNRAWLHFENTDTVNFRALNTLKEINPQLKILISIGGWDWSENFSDAVYSDTSRKTFAVSSVAIIAKYNLDGVDIDWEYPGKKGQEGNIFREEDKQNYTLMFQAIRKELDSLQAVTGKKYLLTTAVGGSKSYIDHTEMDKAQQYLDYVNIMSYDYGGTTASHHTNLYPSKKFESKNSAHTAVTDYIAAGVPAGKLVMGIAFYGRSWILESSENRGANQKIIATVRGGGYSYIKDSLENQKGFRSYWDKKANAPYMFKADSSRFLSYDNERSVEKKCKYVRKNELAGVMFWEYSSDSKGYLLTAINNELK